MDTIKINAGACKMVAHRGVSGLEKENSMAAFIAAGNRSYYGIETDVHRTADGRYVVIHDEKTGRVAGTDIDVTQSTFEQVREILLNDINDGQPRADLHIPTLEEYIRACRRYDKFAVLELKDDFTTEQLCDIVRIIRREDYLHRVVFISFLLQDLTRLRTILPQQPVQYLVSKVDEAVVETLVSEKMDLDAHRGAVDKALVERLHAHGIQVNVWTVNDEAEAQRLLDAGVDYITSNILEGGKA